MGLAIAEDAQPSAHVPRVLVVDDESVIRDLIARALEAEDYIVETARDGYGALAAIETFLPDVLVLDLVMPGMPGDEVLRSLRKREIRLPTLVVSASLNGRTLATDGGADLYMLKPFDLDLLCEQVQYLASLAEAERIAAADRTPAVCASHGTRAD